MGDASGKSGSGRKLNEKRGVAETKGSEGTPWGNVDPVAFQIYLKLALMNTWSVEYLKALDLSPNTLLSLLAICRRFGILEAIKNLEGEADAFIRSFHHFKDTDEFLEMSQSNLATVLSSEELQLTEMDIFECVCRWAEHQCTETGIEKSGKNIRGVLGAVLFEIRFPRMSSSEFSEVGRLQSNLLSQLEQLAIYGFIRMDGKEKQKYDGSQLPFKTHARKHQKTKKKFGCSTLCLAKNRKFVEIPPFVCDGLVRDNCFQISGGRIALHGVGFLGPIDEDSYFDVTVQIQRWINIFSVAYDSGTKKKRIFARKREMLYFMFDEPIIIEQSDDKSTWNWDNYYGVYFWLKGPNTIAVDRNFGDEDALDQSGVKFRFGWGDGRNQFAEFLYKKL